MYILNLQWTWCFLKWNSDYFNICYLTYLVYTNFDIKTRAILRKILEYVIYFVLTLKSDKKVDEQMNKWIKNIIISEFELEI